MKLANLHIRDFRGLSNTQIDFTDELGRIRNLTLIVGPNGSGKTSILDAIWFGLQGQIGFRVLRPAFRPEPRYVVSTGQRYAEIAFQLSITEEERRLIREWKDELVKEGIIGHHPGPDNTNADIIWTYPAQPGYEEKPNGSGYKYPNHTDWAVLRGKDYARRLAKISALPVPGREQVGGVYFFEQERQIVANPIYSLHSNNTEEDKEDETESPTDIRSKLIDFGVKEQLGHIAPPKSWYKRIRESYEYICVPHKMGEVYANQSDGEYEIDFIDADGRHYSFDGLSSGERAVLNFMTQYFAKNMRNSIVLIDELELHLHPTWQRRVLQNFLRLEDGNQFIVTTHSPALRQTVSPDDTIELGELGDIPNWQTTEETE